MEKILRKLFPKCIFAETLLKPAWIWIWNSLWLFEWMCSDCVRLITVTLPLFLFSPFSIWGYFCLNLFSLGPVLWRTCRCFIACLCALQGQTAPCIKIFMYQISCDRKMSHFQLTWFQANCSKKHSLPPFGQHSYHYFQGSHLTALWATLCAHSVRKPSFYPINS